MKKPAPADEGDDQVETKETLLPTKLTHKPVEVIEDFEEPVPYGKLIYTDYRNTLHVLYPIIDQHGRMIGLMVESEDEVHPIRTGINLDFHCVNQVKYRGTAIVHDYEE